MNPNSNLNDLPWTKIEIDSENECSSRKERLYWNSEKTTKLIEIFENECKELWDNKHPLNKDRAARQTKHEYLANMFGTTSDEISRKLHNLRTQFNNELRKIKRKQAGGEVAQGASGWEYFDAMLFLIREPSSDPNDSIDGINLALAEFQADEDIEFGAKARLPIANSTVTTTPRKIMMRVATPATPPLPSNAYPLVWPDDPQPSLLSSVVVDDSQIFGDFVASELRTFRSQESRKRLKRIIQKAILKVGDEEDIHVRKG